MYRQFFINNISELVSAVIDDTFNATSEICIIAKYNDAIKILKSLLLYEKSSIADIDISSMELSGYDKEFLITVGAKFDIWCQKMIVSDNPNKYIKYDCSHVYIMGDCKQKCVAGIDASKVSIVELRNLDKSDTEYETCISEDKIDSNNEWHGFTKSWCDGEHNYSYSFYSSDRELVKNEFTKI